MFILVELVELVELIELVEWWKDYYPIPDASGVTTMTTIFECSFNPLIVG